MCLSQTLLMIYFLNFIFLNLKAVLNLPYICKFSLTIFMPAKIAPSADITDKAFSVEAIRLTKHQSHKHWLRWNILKVQESQSKPCLLTLTFLLKASKMPCSLQEHPEVKGKRISFWLLVFYIQRESLLKHNRISNK